MSSDNKGKPKGSLKTDKKKATKAELAATELSVDRKREAEEAEQDEHDAPEAAKSEKPVKASAAGKDSAAAAFSIPEGHSWNNLWKIFAGVALVGAIMSGIGYTADPKRFAFSYLTGFTWGITLALGGFFFVILQHITRSGWSVVVRRPAEHLMSTLPLFGLLWIPIWIFRESLYPWATAEGQHEHAIHAKVAYLNVPFWTGRAVLFFVIWSFFAWRFSKLSQEQDVTGDPKLSLKMEGLSFPALALFGLTATFGVGIDWLMSLEPAWYSTIFGVWIFAGAVVSMFAFMNVFFARGQAAGLFKSVTRHHFHDLGKLMFGFTIFWAYISFSQYLLQWYANIPEETVYYLHRQENGWAPVGLFIILGHFFFPFFLVLSRNAKKPAILTFGGLWVLVMHFIDLYYFVMPMHDHHFHFNPVMDLGPWLLVIGAMFALIFKRLVSVPVVPLRDPRLDRSLSFENV
jgi:hypothetical protein